jgi:hypothetical protein
MRSSFDRTTFFRHQIKQCLPTGSARGARHTAVQIKVAPSQRGSAIYNSGNKVKRMLNKAVCPLSM